MKKERGLEGKIKRMGLLAQASIKEQGAQLSHRPRCVAQMKRVLEECLFLSSNRKSGTGQRNVLNEGELYNQLSSASRGRLVNVGEICVCVSMTRRGE